MRALPSLNLKKKRNCSQARKKGAVCEEQVLSSEFEHPTLGDKVLGNCLGVSKTRGRGRGRGRDGRLSLFRNAVF